MRTFIHTLVVTVAFSLMSGMLLANNTFNKGLKAHGEKKYALAIELFSAVIKESPDNVSAYYNLGLSSMGAKEYGVALWAFEKVLKLSPNDAEAHEKAEYCTIQLNRSEEWTPILGSFKSGLYSISSDKWSILAIISSVLLSLSIIIFKRSQTISLKRLTLICGFCFILLLCFSMIVAASAQSYQTTENYAIVTKHSIPTFIDEGSTAKTNLMEGTRLKLIDKKTSEYVHVQNDFGDEYIVKAEDLMFI